MGRTEDAADRRSSRIALPRARLGVLAMLVASFACICAAAVGSAAGRSAGGHRSSPYACSDPHSQTRDASNPLALPKAPGPNPLNGANFFIDGPAHGPA